MVVEEGLNCDERMAERHISMLKLLANGDRNEWFKRFKILNRWNAATSALKLLTLLEGETLAVWLKLSEEQQGEYETAKKVVCKAMMPMELVSLDEFR